MDEIMDFFNVNKPNCSQRIIVAGSQSNGIRELSEEEMEERCLSARASSSYTESGTQYADEYIEQQLLDAVEMQRLRITNDDGTLCGVEDMTSAAESAQQIPDIENLTKVYEKYPIHSTSKELTIGEYKSKILSTIASNAVTVIEGPTGCGKTTQVPQWILQDHFSKRRHCNIIVTQPRRIAATSIAKRVCEESNVELGTMIGYQIGLDSKISTDTRLQYVTTRILLQNLVTVKNMNAFTHVVLDEVHERNLDMDFLLIVIKKMLNSNSRNVKVILMSATFQADKFASYLSPPSAAGEYNDIPIITIRDRKMYDVGVYYLNEMSRLGEIPEIKFDEPRIAEQSYKLIIKLLNAIEKIDVDEDKNTNAPRPGVLIFLPGILEIEQLFNVLTDSYECKKIDAQSAINLWWVLPLHSTITADEQAKVFQKPPLDHRKIILATNIAESSITVTDIKYVIDFCLTRVLVSEASTNFASLHTTWAAKSNCIQRAGRAGRVRSGRVYRMVSKDFFENLDDYIVPEIMRCPLGQAVLSTKNLAMGSPKAVLALAMDPPDISQINCTVQNLKEIGALLKTVSGKIYPDDGDITYLGRIMSKLPVDMNIAKLIVLGYVYGCLEECIIIGAAMTTKNLFSTPFQDKSNAYNSKFTWADGSTSDCLAFLKVYKVYQHSRKMNVFSSYKGGERQWARSMFLQINALRNMNLLVSEIKRKLSVEGISSVYHTDNNPLWNEVELNLVLKFVLAGAFYPNYFIISPTSPSQEIEASKTLCGRDPRNTVYMNGFDNRQPGILYAKSIKKMFENHGLHDATVGFDEGGGRVYITFPNDDEFQNNRDKMYAITAGNVVFPVYRAVKLRALRETFELNVMPYHKSHEYLRNLGLYGNNGKLIEQDTKEISKTMSIIQPRLPEIDENYICVKISHMIDCGHFWCRSGDDATDDQLAWLKQLMNCPGALAPLSATDPVQLRELYIAPYKETVHSPAYYYRATIIRVLGNNYVLVRFIDYGNTALVPVNSLRKLVAKNKPGSEIAKGVPTADINALAFECVLSEVIPSLVKDQRAMWTPAAIRRFANLTFEKSLNAKVYSVVLNVVSLELFLSDESINQILIKEGFAQPTEENYNSKINHELRENAVNMMLSQIQAINKQQQEERTDLYKMAEIEPPPTSNCRQTIYLKGPFSPLETTIHSVLHSGKDKHPKIEWNSVNTVLLNTQPQCHNERLLVAAVIDQVANQQELTLRDTTVMPNIVGLPALVALTFCPTAELRYNKETTKYTAALCGLGHHEGSPLYSEHDMLINIDVDLDNEDLESINHLRSAMDSLLVTQEGQDIPELVDNFKNDITITIKKILDKILSRRRKYVEPSSDHRGWYWSTKHADNVTVVRPPQLFDRRAIFPLHGGIVLRERNADELKKLSIENRQLHELKNSNITINKENAHKLHCKLCDINFNTMKELRLHILSRMHRENEDGLPNVDSE